LRTVAHGDRRVAEAKRFGLEPVISPASHGILRAALGSALGRTDPGGMRAEETEIAA
jgi:hypothetical protein